MKTPATSIAHFGPEGSFANMVAQLHFGEQDFAACRTVGEVFDFVASSEDHCGIVPVENSTGGIIQETIREIAKDDSANVRILEEITLDVKLALLGRQGNEISKVYSYFAPLDHCRSWLKQHYAQAQLISVGSTSQAAAQAASEDGAAAIGTKKSADLHGLEILQFPIADEVPNVTQFFLIGHPGQSFPGENLAEGFKTSLVVKLANQAGTLCQLLSVFGEQGVNLTRIESNPVAGEPNTYRFFIEIDGDENDPAVMAALQAAQACSISIRSAGSYPAVCRYQS
ncbi:MAG: prephenate dehydratase domain-containing protein [Verrucomicrobiota bacterium]